MSMSDSSMRSRERLTACLKEMDTIRCVFMHVVVEAWAHN
jgi:hypothetical protein